ncbi:methyltransferase domain-containing protein [Biformimicrobium ophioploci]|uniref:tRNA 5-carboxymethoxyuridine methyltransferase n=1 Tax=Biformimicrobium ophioploci TaxID=3036711 RepID=A0ABQ6LWH1_9GAMM|nr:methyltransferase domain-containing protein [Microbulbifer sp. NKW57]GMG86413.1 methyltransferase domain-containing protein [Microbulbifer sp. NKW57]
MSGERSREDRNFDDLVQHFESKVYGGRKGAIRLAVLRRDLERLLDARPPSAAPLRVLDIGGGLGQLACWLAGRGHRVTYNDLSDSMLLRAREHARNAGLEDRITWHGGPYQSLVQGLVETAGEPFDLVLCHALLEWLAEPEALFPVLNRLVAPGGHLSLCFYNPAGKTMRNLVAGNFLALQRQARADDGSLTPNSAMTLDLVQAHLASAGFGVEARSGLRVFNDYVFERRGGNADDNAVIEMELLHSDREPFWRIGRYLHLLARAEAAGAAR